MHFTSSSGGTQRFPPASVFERPIGAVPVRGAEPSHIRVKQSIHNDPHVTADEEFFSSQYKRPHIPATNRFRDNPRYTDSDADTHPRNPTRGQYHDHTRIRDANGNQRLRNPVHGQFQNLRNTNAEQQNPTESSFENSHKTTNNQFKPLRNPAENPYIQSRKPNPHHQNKQQSTHNPQVGQFSDFSDELPAGWMTHQQRPR